MLCRAGVRGPPGFRVPRGQNAPNSNLHTAHQCVFSIHNNNFDDDTDRVHADYIELSLQLHINAGHTPIELIGCAEVATGCVGGGAGARDHGSVGAHGQ